MLRSSFCHLPGIGLKKERAFWEKGVLTWDDFLRQGRAGHASARFRDLLLRVEESLQQLRQHNTEYFAKLLPRSELWRLFGTFDKKTAYLDIETSGMGQGLDHITCIGLFDGQQVQTFVHGRNLECFADRILEYKLLVTFNGSCFDLPMIERELQITLPEAHIDLRFLLKSLGYTGGLKAVEQDFGLDRGLLNRADGFLAVQLWNGFQTTDDERYLETLLAYNAEDVINLEFLMSKAYNLKRAASGLDTQPCPEVQHPFPNPYQVFPEILEQYQVW